MIKKYLSIISVIIISAMKPNNTSSKISGDLDSKRELVIQTSQN